MAFMDSALRYQGAAVSTLTGLSHLEGKTVKVITNGALHADRVVSGGSITLDRSTTDAWVGLNYTSRLRTLQPELPVAAGTIQGATKRVSRVTVRVLNSMGGRVTIPDESVSEPLIRRNADDTTGASPPLRSGDYDVNLSSDYEKTGRLVIIQDDPLPLDVLSVMVGLSVGGE
jgi:hypothetical protein